MRIVTAGNGMKIFIADSRRDMAVGAATRTRNMFLEAINAREGTDPIIANFAVAKSQVEFQAQLAADRKVPWGQIIASHMDNYAIETNHPASFGRVLQDDFIAKLPSRPADFWRIDASHGDLERECAELNARFGIRRPAVVCMGIGENGHLAFNDPPADFTTQKLFIPVKLDERCRRQQVEDGAFPELALVPHVAVSMSIYGLLSATTGIVCTVPGPRKAEAVRNLILSQGKAPDPMCPSSALWTVANKVWLFLDPDSASLIQDLV